MANATCSIGGCGRMARNHGLCPSHHRRLEAYGDPLAGPPIRRYNGVGGGTPLDIPDRFWPKVDSSAPLGCWPWQGAIDPQSGYGRFQVGKKSDYAHRISYELSIDTIGRGLQIDHLCRNRVCVNPLHLQAVPQSANMRRTPARSVTHCPQGHPYTGGNLYEYDGHRQCRACRKARAAAA